MLIKSEPVATVKKFSLEVQVLEREVRLHNACGFDSSPQDILLSWDVGGLGYPVQVVQVTEGMTQRGRCEERKYNNSRRVKKKKKGKRRNRIEKESTTRNKWKKSCQKYQGRACNCQMNKQLSAHSLR